MQRFSCESSVRLRAIICRSYKFSLPQEHATAQSTADIPEAATFKRFGLRSLLDNEAIYGMQTPILEREGSLECGRPPRRDRTPARSLWHVGCSGGEPGFAGRLAGMMLRARAMHTAGSPWHVTGECSTRGFKRVALELSRKVSQSTLHTRPDEFVSDGGKPYYPN